MISGDSPMPQLSDFHKTINSNFTGFKCIGNKQREDPVFYATHGMLNLKTVIFGEIMHYKMSRIFLFFIFIIFYSDLKNIRYKQFFTRDQ